MGELTGAAAPRQRPERCDRVGLPDAAASILRWWRTRRWAAALCGGLVVGSACHRSRPPDAPAPQVRIAGSTLVDGLVEEYARAIPGIRFSAVRSGPVDAIETLGRGDAEIAVAFADAVYLAYASNADQGRVRAIASLADLPLYLLAGRQTSITRVSDLRGHSVRTRTGDPASDLRFRAFQVRIPDPRRPELPRDDPRSVSEVVLSAFGLELHEVTSVTASPEEALSRLKTGTLDASFATTTASVAFREALESGARVVAIDGPSIERLRQEYPLIRRVRVPPGTLPGQTVPINTVGVSLVLVGRRDLDSALVYQLTRAYVENVSRLGDREPLLKTSRLEDGPVTPIPLHEGAARFYRQWEMVR